MSRPVPRARAVAGFLLLPVALLLVLVGALAFMANRGGPMETQLGGGEREATIAQAAAEAGLQHALWRAHRNSCSGYDLASTAFETHSYQVDFTPAAGSPVNVVATATTATGASARLARDDVPIYDGVTTTVLQPGAAEGVDDNPDRYWPNNNHGLTPQMWVDDNNERGLIRFDLGAIPPGARILEARLELYKFSGNAPAGASIDAFRVTRDWQEGTGDYSASGDGASWNTSDGTTPWTTAGVDFDPTPAARNPDISGNGWKAWDITALANAWMSGTVANQGVVLKATPGVGYIKFHTSDAANATLHPRLTLTYYPCECGGTTSGLLLQPGADGDDTYMDEVLGTQNFGADAAIQLSGRAGNERRGLLRFDLSWLPPAATVTSAVMTLDLGNTDTGSVSVHRMTRAWAEGDGSTGGSCYRGASWQRYAGCSAWAAGGGEFDATEAAKTIVDPATPGATNWDLTTLVTDIHAGTYPNHGFLLQASSGINVAFFRSGDAADPAQHPKLAINYSCPCGVDCTPGPPPARDYMDTLPLECSSAGADNASAGSEDWSPWAWTEIGESNLWCNGSARIETDLGDPSILLKAHDTGVERELDLSAFDAAWLSFDYRFDDVEAGNGLRVRVSGNGGADWVELDPINASAEYPDYRKVLYDLSPYRAADTRIAFIASLPVTTGAPANIIYIDDIQVTSEEPAAPPTGFVLATTGDSYVSENSSGSNYGSDTEVYAGRDGSGPGRHYRSMLRFDLSALPAGATVLTARLRLYLTGGNGASVDLGVYRVGTGWTEGAVTWANSGGGTPAGSAYDTVTAVPSAPGWVEWTIPPALLHEWKDAVTPNDGLVLVSSSGKGLHAQFASRENATAANRPQLVITYSE